MNSKLKLALAIGLVLGSSAVFAQDVNPKCTTSCDNSTQTMGDTSSSADNSTSQASQSNPSAVSNSSASGVTVSPQVQQSGNTTADQNSLDSHATGGNATGNLSTNNNQSSVGNTTATSGGNNTSGTNTNDNQSAGGSVTAGTAGIGSGNGSGNTTEQGQQQGQTQTGTNKQGQVAVGQGGKVGNTTSGSTSGAANRTRVGDVGSTSGAASYSGGNKTASNVGESGNSITKVDASDHSSRSSSYTDNSRTQFIPSVVPETPPAMLGVGQISTSRSACGPQQVVVHANYDSHYFGLFKTKTFNGGVTDSLEPAMLAGAPDPFVIIKYQNGSEIWLGDQVIISTAVLGNASGRNFALGGGSGSGSWGQAGMGATSSVQKMVTTITVVQCVFATHAAVQEQPQVIYQEVPQKSIRQ